jgi:hypothetical protein
MKIYNNLVTLLILSLSTIAYAHNISTQGSSSKPSKKSEVNLSSLSHFPKQNSSKKPSVPSDFKIANDEYKKDFPSTAQLIKDLDANNQVSKYEVNSVEERKLNKESTFKSTNNTSAVNNNDTSIHSPFERSPEEKRLNPRFSGAEKYWGGNSDMSKK